MLQQNKLAQRLLNLMLLGIITSIKLIKMMHCIRYSLIIGWSWGGNWKSKKDYQHFEKNIS